MDSLPHPPAGIPSPLGVEHEIVIYMTPYCGFCLSALRLLDARELPYLRVDVAGNNAAREWLRKVTGRTTVPQIFIKGRSIGGYTELSAIDRDQGIAALLSDAG